MSDLNSRIKEVIIESLELEDITPILWIPLRFSAKTKKAKGLVWIPLMRLNLVLLSRTSSVSHFQRSKKKQRSILRLSMHLPLTLQKIRRVNLWKNKKFTTK